MVELRVRSLPVAATVVLAALATLLVAGCATTSSPPSDPTPARAAAGSPTGALDAPATNLKRSSAGGSVTVDVTWQKATAGDALLFAVAMNTHYVDLDGFDLARLAVLRNDAGKEVPPQAWDAPPGGHHRSGTLTFPATVDGGPLVSTETKYIELIVRDVAGVKERQFRWEVSS